MYKLLVNNTRGGQHILSVNGKEFDLVEGKKIYRTGYFDKSKVLWDEREDGPIPENAGPNLGGLSRVGNELQVDTAMRDAFQAARDAEIATIEQKKLDKESAKTRLKSVNWSDMTTVAKLKAVLKDIHEVMDL